MEYAIVPSETPGFWHWRFWIGDAVKSGTTETNLEMLAIRRVQVRIDRALKEAEQKK